MLLTVKVKLRPSEEQQEALQSTMERFNAACNGISSVAFSTMTFNRVRLHHLTYYEVRHEHGLSAQLTVRAIAKVADSYRSTMSGIRERNKIHRAKKEPVEVLKRIEFREHGAVVYDPHIMTINKEGVGLTTLKGRMTIPFVNGNILQGKKLEGEADLICVRGRFYLCVITNKSEEPLSEPSGFLGVDLGIVNIASTSDGMMYSGKVCDRVRERYMNTKAALQSAGTKSAKRHLKLISGRERRFKTNVNHIISKRIVQVAKDTKRAIVLEDLRHIRSRVTVNHDQRERFFKWAFNQLRQFLEYKAKIAGVIIELVDGSYTSRQCSVCGYTDMKNRKSQSEFRCLACGHAENADVNAAKNIVLRATVNWPIAVCQVTGS